MPRSSSSTGFGSPRTHASSLSARALPPRHSQAATFPSTGALTRVPTPRFRENPAPEGVHKLALQAARVCRVGYSSQDWMADHDGHWWFLDLNPAGQWLFLPAQVADRVTQGLADWLDAETT